MDKSENHKKLIELFNEITETNEGSLIIIYDDGEHRTMGTHVKSKIYEKLYKAIEWFLDK